MIVLINAYLTTAISANDTNWYQLITGKLTSNQVESLQNLLVYATQRRAQAGECCAYMNLSYPTVSYGYNGDCYA